MDAIRELKVRAEILHKQIKASDSRALARLRRTDAETVRLHDCLTPIAADWGFPSWPEARKVLSGEGEPQDFGTLLCPPRFGGGHINQWFVRYEEAAAAREACNGYLLAYRRQYLVVDRFYIEDLGLDPDDPDWSDLG